MKIFIPAFFLLLLLQGCVPQEEKVLVESDRPWSAVRIYQKASPAVATVIAVEGQAGSGQGSAFLTEDDYLVTNAHVVLQGEGIADSIFIEWSSKNRSEAEVLRIDKSTDLAVLRASVPGGVEPLRISRKREVFPGEPVAAIGSPFGEAQSLSTGIVSATGRSVQSLTDFAIEDAIQTDASINPGNSGGPLLDARGEVIGVNQQIQTRSGGNDGVGYAVPASALLRILGTLRDDRPLRYAYLGVSLQEAWPELAKRIGIPKGALLVSSLVPGGPAERAGLRGGTWEEFFQGTPVQLGGDAIVSLDGQKVSSLDDLQKVLSGKEPGDNLPLVVLRNGKRISLDIRLGERPNE